MISGKFSYESIVNSIHLFWLQKTFISEACKHGFDLWSDSPEFYEQKKR